MSPKSECPSMTVVSKLIFVLGTVPDAAASLQADVLYMCFTGGRLTRVPYWRKNHTCALQTDDLLYT